VDGVSFKIEQGKTLGIVGESGCGKSVTCHAVLRLIQTPPGEIASGQVLLRGNDLLKLTEPEMRNIRGAEIAMIFQEPMTSLNPVFTCGDQVMEAVILHQKLDKVKARERALEMFKLVGIPDPSRRLDEYPHQLSGGLRQRVMIAMALSCDPALLICDEPTTALDVTIQAQIIELLKRLQRELGMTIILITHDLGVVAEIADEVIVMYAGQIVERGSVYRIYHQPQHPYTIGLQKAIPHLGQKRDKLQQIEGTVPMPLAFPTGCRFHPRCPISGDECRTDSPALKALPVGGDGACWKIGMFEPATLYENSSGNPT
jgi:oligopeptide/dipeptide ABC transporter ATP-binding protein